MKLVQILTVGALSTLSLTSCCNQNTQKTEEVKRQEIENFNRCIENIYDKYKFLQTIHLYLNADKNTHYNDKVVK